MSDRPTPKKVIERFDRKGFLTESEFNVLRDELTTTKRQRDAAVEALKDLIPVAEKFARLAGATEGWLQKSKFFDNARAVLREIEGGK